MEDNSGLTTLVVHTESMEQLKIEVEKFIASGINISNLWCEEFELQCDEYPFDESFDEVIHNILTWVETFKLGIELQEDDKIWN